jgi:hypothetical protein
MSASEPSDEDSLTSRSNCAKDSSTLRVNRPMLVVVLKDWVTTQMGAPLTAQPMEIEALEVSDDRQKGSIQRQQSARRWRRRSLPRPPGACSRGGHADYAACIAFRLGPRPSIASRSRSGRSPRSAGTSEIR